VGRWLADQLLVPIALAGQGAFRTLSLSPHATTNADVIRAFLPVRVSVTGARDDVMVEVSGATP
jgi:RNA 3'-terminal phosphate cyclase (ATP)